MPQKGEDIVVVIFIIIIVALALLGLLVALSSFLSAFSRELRYLNREIKRTSGREREYWVRRKRKLWRSLLPFCKY